MPARNRVPSFQIASGTANQRDNSYNIPTGSIFFNTDTSNIELSGNVVVAGDISATNVVASDISATNVVAVDASFTRIDAVDASFSGNISAVDASFTRIDAVDASFSGNISAGDLIVQGVSPSTQPNTPIGASLFFQAGITSLIQTDGKVVCGTMPTAGDDLTNKTYVDTAIAHPGTGAVHDSQHLLWLLAAAAVAAIGFSLTKKSH